MTITHPRARQRHRMGRSPADRRARAGQAQESSLGAHFGGPSGTPFGAGPAPKQRHPQQGHFHVIQHGEANETQAIRMTDADVVTWLTDPDDPTA